MKTTTNAEALKVGAFIFPDFELLDLFGPLELLGLLRDRVAITLMAEQRGEVASRQGPKSVVDLTLADAPRLDVLLIPGGMGARAVVENPSLLDLLRLQATNARFVATVCTGSAVLARTGILDGRRATSNKLSFEWATSQGPNVTWIREARWVEDGKFFTSSGVSAGMDMTLGLIQHLFGREISLQVARWAEYTWHEDRTIDPFANYVALESVERKR